MKTYEEKKDELKLASAGLYEAVIIYLCEEIICCVANKSCFNLVSVLAAVGPAENVEKAKVAFKEFGKAVGELYITNEQFIPF